MHAQLLVIKEPFLQAFLFTGPRLALMLRRVCAGSAAASTLQMYDGPARRLAPIALISSSCGQPQPPPLTAPCKNRELCSKRCGARRAVLAPGI